MKKITLAFLALFLLFSCKDSNRLTCASCDTFSPDKQAALFGDDLAAISFQVYYANKSNTNNNFHLAFHYTGQDSIIQKMDLFNLIQKNDENIPISIVLYFNNRLDKSEKLNLDSSRAALYFYLKEGRLYVDGFDCNELSYRFKSIEVDAISTNDFVVFARQMDLDQRFFSAVSLRSNYEFEVPDHAVFLHQVLGANYLKSKKAPDVPDKPKKDKEGCQYPCFEAPDMNCMSNGDGTFDCYGRTCGINEAEKVSGKIIDKSTFYDIRAELSTSELGKSYINDYYYLSSIIKEEGLSVRNGMKAVELSKIAIPILKKYLSEDNSQILYQEDIEIELIDFLDSVNELSDDEEFKRIVSDVRYLIISNSGKSIAAIRDQFR